ncbi:hypothetical protein DDR33_19795 [Pararcticibacter amylolyticus]|uniref:Uncharacterized protein n=1 Tax=Pararcticibacter amylolyticus TaxID=2173175 RepID=A0A2U2PC10_9SPHI|nr:hypothetical protein DDR33_19795 [Pararcticibacter amylolyticus]
MSFYYVNNNRQYDGAYEVHKEGCCFMPMSRTFLGYFDNVEDAVKEARRYHGHCRTCIYCSTEYHQALYTFHRHSKRS